MAAPRVLLGQIKTWFFVIALVFLTQTFPAIAAIDPGTPFIKHYGAESYDVMPRHLAITKDAKGRIVVATSEGVLVRQFGKFKHIKLPGATYGRSFALGADQTLYVGGYDQLGKLEEAPDGSLSYVSLVDKFPLTGSDVFFGDVWDVQANRDAVFFMVTDRILRLDYNGNASIIPYQGEGRTLAAVRDQLYLRVAEVGLLRLVGSRFELVPGGGLFKDKTLVAMIDRKTDLLLCAGKYGFYRLTDTGIDAIDTPLNKLAAQVTPYSMTTLRDGTYGAVTLTGEILQITPQFELTRRFKASDYPLIGSVADAEGGLWAVSEGDVIRVSLPSAWSSYGNADGLYGSLQDAAWYKDTLWVGTGLGVYRGDPDEFGRLRFRNSNWTQDEIWDLETVSQGVLMTRRRGIDLIQGDSHQELVKLVSPFAMQRSKFDANLIWVLAENDVLALDVGGEKIRERFRLALNDVSVSTLVEMTPNRFLVGNYRGIPILVDWDKTSNLVRAVTPIAKSATFQPSTDQPTSFFQVDESIFLAQGNDLWQWHGPSQGLIQTQPDENFSQLQPFDELTVVKAANGIQYAHTLRNLFERRAPSAPWQRIDPRDPSARGVVRVVPQDDGRLIVLNWNGLLFYDANIKPAPPPQLQVKLSSLTMHTRGKAEQRLELPEADDGLSLPPHDSLRFDFGVESGEEGFEFRDRLKPIDSVWTNWSQTKTREWHQLQPGQYELLIEARAANGQSVKSLRLKLDIQPRWYQMRGVQLLGALSLMIGFLALGAAISARRQRRVENQNRQLERMVEDRTSDLAQANQRLARIADLDGLTGVANRRRFDGYLQHQWELCQLNQEPLALLMVDVDHFKKFNDTRGHQAGDDELRAIARELQSAIQTDRELVARYGGEEFSLILPGVYLIEASRRAEALRTQIATRPSRHPMTVSIGVVSAVPNDRIQTRDLLQAADSALYQAKNKGRNRVEIAEMGDF